MELRIFYEIHKTAFIFMIIFSKRWYPKNILTATHSKARVRTRDLHTYTVYGICLRKRIWKLKFDTENFLGCLSQIIRLEQGLGRCSQLVVYDGREVTVHLQATHPKSI